ncbi:MAG: Crp/Fnr family transcriptional regulator [Bacteroidota bacterium]
MQTFRPGLAQLLLRGYELNSTSANTQLEQLQKEVHTHTVKKGEVLLKAGDPGNSIYFVNKGLLRTYTVDKNGKEHSFMFAPEGWFFSDFESADVSSPSVYFIDALEHSEIETVHKSVLHTLKSSWQGHKHTIETLRKRVAVLEQRIIMLQSASAGQRYQHFIDTYPGIVQRIPQKMIATYLGITPESLSRVRKEVVG